MLADTCGVLGVDPGVVTAVGGGGVSERGADLYTPQQFAAARGLPVQVEDETLKGLLNVLLATADAHRAGREWVSRSQLARSYGLGPRTLHSALWRLQGSGVLERVCGVLGVGVGEVSGVADSAGSAGEFGLPDESHRVAPVVAGEVREFLRGAGLAVPAGLAAVLHTAAALDRAEREGVVLGVAGTAVRYGLTADGFAAVWRSWQVPRVEGGGTVWAEVADLIGVDADLRLGPRPGPVDWSDPDNVDWSDPDNVVPVPQREELTRLFDRLSDRLPADMRPAGAGDGPGDVLDVLAAAGNALRWGAPSPVVAEDLAARVEEVAGGWRTVLDGNQTVWERVLAVLGIDRDLPFGIRGATRQPDQIGRAHV